MSTIFGTAVLTNLIVITLTIHPVMPHDDTENISTKQVVTERSINRDVGSFFQHRQIYGLLAQSGERDTVTVEVTGSKPV